MKFGVLALPGSRWILAVALFFLTAPPLLFCSVQVADPTTYPNLAQNARVTVLFDGKPLAGAKVEVQRPADANAILTLLSNGEGEVVIPEVPRGCYNIVVMSSPGPYHASSEICIDIDPGIDFPVVTEVLVEDLDGKVVPPIALHQLTIDVGPFPSTMLEHLLAVAEWGPTTSHLQRLSGLVVTRAPAGMPLPKCWVGVLRRGAQGYEEAAAPL